MSKKPDALSTALICTSSFFIETKCPSCKKTLSRVSYSVMFMIGGFKKKDGQRLILTRSKKCCEKNHFVPYGFNFFDKADAFRQSLEGHIHLTKGLPQGFTLTPQSEFIETLSLDSDSDDD